MRNVLLLLLIALIGSSCVTLHKTLLPKELNESSALVVHNNLFLTVNDSDNPPIIFVFNEKGEVLHQSYVANSFNWDWEALTYDGEKYLYIGDIGNNLNDRKDLRIFRVEMEKAMTEDTVFAEAIYFNYPEQTAFPPVEEEWYYDAEAMIYKDGEILIFTKNRTVPFDGISKVYSVPTEIGTHDAQFLFEIQLPPTHWIEECITDATYYKDELYLLTYSKLYRFKWKNGEWQKDKEWLHRANAFTFYKKLTQEMLITN